MKYLVKIFAVVCFALISLSLSAQNKSYKVGDYYDDGTKQGVVFQVSEDGQHGKIVSLVQTKLRWCNRSTTSSKGGNVITKAQDLDDGEVNCNIIKGLAGLEDYHAFNWCRELGEGWYLPALRELKSLYDVKKVVGATLKEHKADKLAGIWFFSSSEIGPDFNSSRGGYSKNFAWVLSMSFGHPSHIAKDEHTVNVRAVAKF